MLAPVQFGDKSCFATGKIDDEWADDELAGELGAMAGNETSYSLLGVSRTVSKRARPLRHFRIDPGHEVPSQWTALRAYPPLAPPFQGGEVRSTRRAAMIFTGAAII